MRHKRRLEQSKQAQLIPKSSALSVLSDPLLPTPTDSPVSTTPLLAKSHSAAQLCNRNALLCSLRAINHIVRFYNRSRVDRHVLDDIADELATAEALRMDDGSGIDNATDTRGNYTVETLMRALRVHGDLSCRHCIPPPASSPSCTTVLAGNGSHWVALLRLNESWTMHNGQQTETVRSPSAYFHYFYSQRNWTFIQVTSDVATSRLSPTANLLVDLQHSVLPHPSNPPTASAMSVPMETSSDSHTGKRKPDDNPTEIPHQFIRINDDEDVRPANISTTAPISTEPLPPPSVAPTYTDPPTTTDMASTTLPQPFQPAFAVPAPLLPCADAEADDSDSASVANSQSSQVPQGHRRHRKRLGMPPKRDNRAERERTAENKVRQASPAMEQLASAGFIPAAPTHHASSTDPTSSHSHASSSQPVGDVYSLPQVTCTNVPAVPTTQRARFHVVVNDFCTNCLLRADSTGHASAERFIFASREAFQQYWDSHYHDDTHNEPL